MTVSPAPLREGNVNLIAAFLRGQVSSANPVIAGAIGGMIWANFSPVTYHAAWHTRHFGFTASGLLSSGLMILFFFVIGLEMRREFESGILKSKGAQAVPMVAAIGGMLAPALVYVFLAGHGPEAKGWAIPTATDIVFVLAALTLCGKRVPQSLKLFMTSLAVFDDLGAILVIALFYTGGIHLAWLLTAGAFLALMMLIREKLPNQLNVLLFAIPVLGWLLHEGGLHSTIAGFIGAFLLPRHVTKLGNPVHFLERRLAPYSSLCVLPLFALAEAGVQWRGFKFGTLELAIICALVIGKPVGIGIAAWIGSRFARQHGYSFAQRQRFLGAASLGGIGFTISLFVAKLAFTDAALLDRARIAILAGSLLSGLLGVAILRFSPSSKEA